MPKPVVVAIATLALWTIGACADVLPTSPLEPNEEKDELRALVEKVKGMATATGAGEVKDSDMVFFTEELAGLDGNDDARARERETADAGMALLMANGERTRASDLEPVVRVAVVRCAPQMMLERAGEGGVMVVVAAGRTRGVIDDER